ncbi:MAG: DNA-binding transcriptional regulator, partial [Planctomycetia bacterium]|nr:DNA-binding transcriptional regulator [Planctomycetia bacterium]
TLIVISYPVHAPALLQRREIHTARRKFDRNLWERCGLEPWTERSVVPENGCVFFYCFRPGCGLHPPFTAQRLMSMGSRRPVSPLCIGLRKTSRKLETDSAQKYIDNGTLGGYDGRNNHVIQPFFENFTMSPSNAMNRTRPTLPRVALLVETSREVGRSILSGIERYARLYGPWAFHLFPGDLAQRMDEVHTWNATGIIARVETPEVAHAILESKLPLVALDLYEEQKDLRGPFRNTCEVHVDSAEVGRIAATHLIEQHYENYAYVCEVNNVLWSKERERTFCQTLDWAGYDCHRYTPPRKGIPWNEEIHAMGKWLEQLPKPIGLMASMDVRGRQVIAACQEYGIRVPEDVAVLGVDNDPLLCRMCSPRMSSVILDSENGGYHAAMILDGLMRGKIHEKKTFLIRPVGIASRESTERSEITDSLIAEAVRFIHLNSMIALSVQEVVSHVKVSRRMLEVRFQKVLGRSVLTEICRARLDRVKNLLLKTDMKVHEIAEACEFGTDGYLCRFFQREAGMTISEFRRQNRIHGK